MKIIPIRANLTVIVFENSTQLVVSYRTCVAATTRNGSFKTEKFWGKTTLRHLNDTGYKNDPTKPQAFFDNLLENAV